MRVEEHWHRLPGQVVESPSWQVLKARPGTVLGSLLWLILL